MNEIDFRSVEPKRAFSLYVSRNEQKTHGYRNEY